MSKKKRIAGILFAGVFIASVTTGYISSSHADEISDKIISSAVEEKKNLEKKKYKVQNELADLENDKRDIMKYIEKIDRKMNSLSEDIREVKEQIAQKEDEIDLLKADIKAAKKQISIQYDAMKKRIRYMYENGNSDYVDILLSSDSISDLFNRTEYIQKISEYDKNMLTNFVNDKAKLEESKASLVDMKEQLEIKEEELKVEQDGVKKMEKRKEKELKEYNKNIKSAENVIEEFDVDLEEQENIIAKALLDEQKRIAKEEERIKREEERKKQEEAEEAEETDEDGEEGQQADATKKPEGTPKPTTAPDVGAVSPTGFRWPLPIAGRITSHFGNRVSPTTGASSYHQGIDIGVAAGTNILAAKSGKVVTAAYSAGAGNYVMINHGGGIFTVYMHASSLVVKVGDEVAQGQLIAYVGSTGISTGNHLHFGISVGGSYVDPEKFVAP